MDKAQIIGLVHKYCAFVYASVYNMVYLTSDNISFVVTHEYNYNI